MNKQALLQSSATASYSMTRSPQNPILFIGLMLAAIAGLFLAFIPLREYAIDRCKRLNDVENGVCRVYTIGDTVGQWYRGE